MSCKWLIPWELESTPAKEQMVTQGTRWPLSFYLSFWDVSSLQMGVLQCHKVLRCGGFYPCSPEACSISGCKDKLDTEANFYISSRLQTAYLTVTSHL